MLKVVLDTVVFVRALINPHNFCGRTLLQSGSQYRLFVSQPLLTELLEVLTRPELTAKFRSLTELDFRGVIDLLAMAEVVDIHFVPPVSRDPNDDMFLATAEAAGADFLVTEDADLLDQLYHDIRIVTCDAFLTALEQQAD